MSHPPHTPAQDNAKPRTDAEVQSAWAADATAENYAGQRWSTSQRRLRDAQRLRSLITKHTPPAIANARWLDVACGTGRLAAAWQCGAANYVGIDSSAAMLAQHPLPGRVLHSSAFELPFCADSFELVVACRFLHHLVKPSDLRRAARELVRVSSSHVAVTFWDAHSLSDWRNPKRGSNASDPRVARTRTEFSNAFEQAGGRLVAYAHSFRFVSRQSYALFAIDAQA